MVPITTRQIAQLCYTTALEWEDMWGNLDNLEWHSASPARKREITDTVEFVVQRLDAPDEEGLGRVLHGRWLDIRRSEGWVYGSVYSYMNRTHPCLVGYDELSPEARVEYDLLMTIVAGFVLSPDVEISREGEDADDV